MADPDRYDAMAAKVAADLFTSRGRKATLLRLFYGADGQDTDGTCLTESRVAHRVAAALREAVADAAESLDTVRLRAEYILGHCRGEDEMKAEARAILAALAAPAVSAWSSTPPKAAGWYWWRDYSKKIERAVSVAAWRGGGLAVHCPEFSDHHDGYTTPERCGGEWQGPIEPK